MPTARMILRRPGAHDAAGVFGGYARDSEVARFVIRHPHERIEETYQFLTSVDQGWASGGEFTWALTLRTDGSLIGMIAIRIDQWKADFGYVVGRQWWNNGNATEAVLALSDWALSQASIFRLWAVCDTENIGSIRVLEKAGFMKEGVLYRWGRLPNVSETPRDCYSFVKYK